ncbi:hypothetical protein P3102_16965 [Amycolatopsis sp. QT-25]|nr:hypothetical protein [Amycolatopsis sp. QT-25]WET82775.1 hypothetical protein P3102_16965 [Amycolatopsis sp. QT-25]
MPVFVTGTPAPPDSDTAWPWSTTLGGAVDRGTEEFAATASAVLVQRGGH